MDERKESKTSTLADVHQFATFALDRMKLSTVHRRKRSKGAGKTVKSKIMRDLGPADTTIHTRDDGLTVQFCVETVIWRVNGSMVNFQGVPPK